MKRVISFLPWIGALLLIAVALLWYESDLLWKMQQNNLFLDTSLYLHDQMLVPGGFLSYVSCFFIQFFYHPWLGVLMLCGWWLLLMWLTKRTFHIADQWTVLALVPVAALLVTDMSLGYWHYLMRLRGYFMVPTIGTTVAAAMLWAFRALPQKLRVRIAGIVVATIIGYPLFGIYALAAVLLMGIWAWRLTNNRTQSAILTVVALLCIIAVPMICYRYIYYQTYFNDLWTTGLPITNVLKNYPVFYIPYYIIGIFFLLMVLFNQRSLSAKLQKPLYRWSLQGILVVVLIVGVWHWWYKDENFHHELVMQHCIEQTDWEGVLEEGLKQGEEEPTRSIIIMHNLALSRLGRIDEIFDFPFGRKMGDPNVPYDMLNLVFSRPIFYQLGMLNDCHRRCMEDGVEFGWSVEKLQYLARCAFLSREFPAAKKAINLLRHTMYYKDWGDNIEKLLVDTRQIAQDPEMGPVSRMSHMKDALGLDEGNVEKYILNVFAYQDSREPSIQEQAVLAALLKRNPQLFWARFNGYTKLFPHGPIPRIFQEAAYLFGKTGHGPNPDLLPIDKGVKDNYNAFAREGKKYDKQQAIVGRTALYPFFGNTYFFYYYFLQDMI